MGRKTKIGRLHKNYKRKRQASKKQQVGIHQSIKLNITLPHMTFPQKWNWFSDSSNTQLCIYKIEDMNANGSMNPSTQHSLVISHSIAINQNLTWSLNVNGQQVDTSLCTCLASVPSVLSPRALSELLL